MRNYSKEIEEAVRQATRQLHEEKEEKERREYGDPTKIKWRFIEELAQKGLHVDYFYHAESLMPEHKDIIVPMVMKYYDIATDRGGKGKLISLLYYKGLDDAVPFLIDKLYNDVSCYDSGDAWEICDCIYQIRSKKYIPEYLKIISDPSLGSSRQMLVSLVGEWKLEQSVPILINLLEDEGVRLHAISALGCFKREEFRPYFERFKDDKHPGWRKYSRIALKKLDAAQSKKELASRKSCQARGGEN